MTWDAISAVAEVFGALAVVVSLAYVALQIKQNTKATRQQSYHDLVTRRTELFFGELVKSGEITNIWIAGAAGEPLDDADSQRFIAVVINIMSHFQDVYLQHANGIVEDQVWSAERRFLGALNSTPGFAAVWRAASQYFLPEFVAEVATVELITPVVFDRETMQWVTTKGGIYRSSAGT